MKRLLVVLCCMGMLMPTYAQEKKKFKLKKPNLRIGEKIGKVAGGLMTGKTASLAATAPMATLVTGIYNTDTKTSEVAYFPKGTEEGDHLLYVTFMKNEGVGMYKIEGDVSSQGQPMEYMGLGTYGFKFDQPVYTNQKILITTETGEKATLEIEPIPEVEILEINGDPTMPIIDLNEDMRIKFTHPAGSEGTTVKIGLLTDVAGARAWNYFADFKSTDKEVLIPKEAFSNLQISGALNTGQVNRGLTYITVTREKIIEQSDAKPGQITGDCASVTLSSYSYGTKPVLVKGKQEHGIITNIKFSGKHKGHYAYSIFKPNAQHGIPFSRASKFGLASLNIGGSTYKKETESGSSSHTIGNTRYTHSWTRTTTLKFPQLPDGHWNHVMEKFYNGFADMTQSRFGVGFVDVEKITGTAAYHSAFTDDEYNTSKGIRKSYKNTKRISPESIREVFANLSSSKSGETNTSTMMEEAGIDGLVSLEINFEIGANQDDKVILIPTVNFSIKGMDESKDNREGTYAEGMLTLSEGVPFNEEALKANPDYLLSVLNIPQILDTLYFMFDNLRKKEVELGYDKIWSIGE